MINVQKGRSGRAMGWIFALGGLAVSACGSGGDAVPGEGSAAEPTPPPPPPPEPFEATPPEPVSPSVVHRFAMFGSDQALLTCAEVTVTIEAGHEPDGGMEAMEAMDARLRAAYGDDGNVRISRPCTEQFADRTEWAS